MVRYLFDSTPKHSSFSIDHLLAPIDTVTEYMEYLIQQNTDHVSYQRNSIDDANDAQRKYLLRRDVKSLISRFVSKEYNSGPFKLFCDDLQPGNVIVDPETLEIVALIDLEWTYAAPYQFLFSPPPWLILERPNSWTSNGMASYNAKFLIFIKSLRDEEAKREKEGHLNFPEDQRMSTLMSRSMDDGKFWFEQLLRDAFNFDGDVVWPKIKSFLQAEELDSIGIPNKTDEADMVAFVNKKMEDLGQYLLDLRLLEEAAEN